MLLMAALILLQSARPELSLTPVVIALFGLAAVLVLMNLGCVLALTPYTSDYVAGSSGRPDPSRMSRLAVSAVQDLGAALWLRWLPRAR